MGNYLERNGPLKIRLDKALVLSFEMAYQISLHVLMRCSVPMASVMKHILLIVVKLSCDNKRM